MRQEWNAVTKVDGTRRTHGARFASGQWIRNDLQYAGKIMAEPRDFSQLSRTDALRGSLKAKSIRGAVFFATSSGTDLALRLLAIVILARYLPPSDFGLIGMVMVVTSVFDGVRDMGLSAATVQREQITHEQVTNLFWLNAAFGCAFALALTVGSPYIANFYGDARLVGVSIGLSLVFLCVGLTVQHEALMTRQMRQGELAFVRIGANVLSLILAIVLAMRGWSYWALVWREVGRSVFVAVGVWWRCRWWPGLPRRHVGTRTLVRFGGELSATNIVTSLIANIDKLLIGRVFGAVPVGLYRQAQQLLVAPIEHLNFPIFSVAQPALSALQAEPARYRRYYEKIVFFVAMATLPVGLFVAIYAEEVTLLMLGQNWSEAAGLVRIFAVAAMLRPALGTSAIVLVTCGYSARFLLIAIVHSVVLVAFVVFGLAWGASGVALAQVGTTVVLMVPKLYYSFLGTPASLAGFGRAVRAPAVAGLAMAAALLGFKSLGPAGDTLVLTLVAGVVGMVVYSVAVWLQRDRRDDLLALVADARAVMVSQVKASSSQ